MTKLRVQAQHLQPGDVVGNGEIVGSISTNKVFIQLDKRSTLWGKYTMINVEREEKDLEYKNKELGGY